METLVKTYRGDLVDLMTTGSVAVVASDGRLAYSAGDPEYFCYARSSAKLMQAVVPVLSGAADAYHLEEHEISQISASHSGEKIHIDTVRGILAKAGLDESFLKCGEHYPFKADVTEAMKANGEKPLNIHNNCSGKHAGMLTTVKHMGEDPDTYYLPEHPHQKRILETIGMICDYAPSDIKIGIDGCGVPVHAMPLQKFAHGMARMCSPEALPEDYQKACQRVVNAVMYNPLYTSGSDRIDYKIMKKYPGRVVVKSGANGYFAGGLPELGLGFAIKTNDGISEMRNIILVEVLHQLGLIPDEDMEYFSQDHDLKIYNYRNEIVGYSEACFQLSKH